MKEETRQYCVKIAFPSFGLCLCFLEVILTAVYQFQMLGFALSFLMFFISAIYLYRGIQYHRFQKKVELGLEPLPDRRMSASTRAIMEV